MPARVPWHRHLSAGRSEAGSPRGASHPWVLQSGLGALRRVGSTSPSTPARFSLCRRTRWRHGQLDVRPGPPLDVPPGARVGHEAWLCSAARPPLDPTTLGQREPPTLSPAAGPGTPRRLEPAGVPRHCHRPLSHAAAQLAGGASLSPAKGRPGVAESRCPASPPPRSRRPYKTCLDRSHHPWRGRCSWPQGAAGTPSPWAWPVKWSWPVLA